MNSVSAEELNYDDPSNWIAEEIVRHRKNTKTKQIEYLVRYRFVGTEEDSIFDDLWHTEDEVEEIDDNLRLAYLRHEKLKKAENAKLQAERQREEQRRAEEEKRRAKIAERETESGTSMTFGSTYLYSPPTQEPPKAHPEADFFPAVAQYEEARTRSSQKLCTAPSPFLSGLVDSLESVFLGSKAALALKAVASCQWKVDAGDFGELSHRTFQCPKVLEGFAPVSETAKFKANDAAEMSESSEEDFHENYTINPSPAGIECEEEVIGAHVAPINESADVLLMVLSFTSSFAFFTSARLVCRRWHNISQQMASARKLVQPFACFLRDEFLAKGAYPVAISSGVSNPSNLSKFLHKARRDLNDPKYTGIDGGDIIPVFTGEAGAVGGKEAWQENEYVAITSKSFPRPLNRNPSSMRVIKLHLARCPTRESCRGKTVDDLFDSMGDLFGRGSGSSGGSTLEIMEKHPFKKYLLATPFLQIKVIYLPTRERESSFRMIMCQNARGKNALNMWRAYQSTADMESYVKEVQAARDFLLSLPPPKVLGDSFLCIQRWIELNRLEAPIQDPMPLYGPREISDLESFELHKGVDLFLEDGAGVPSEKRNLDGGAGSEAEKDVTRDQSSVSHETNDTNDDDDDDDDDDETQFPANVPLAFPGKFGPSAAEGVLQFLPLRKRKVLALLTGHRELPTVK